MRCPDCNKFAAYEEAEPEVEVEYDGLTGVSIHARIVNTCEQCSTELKEATFDWEEDISEPLKAHKCTGEDFCAEETGAERISRSGNFVKGVFVPKGGRYGKMFYGASVEVEVTCNECGERVHTLSVEDYAQTSSMEELT